LVLPPDATIAVVGASARAAAQSVLRSGRRVVAADLFADADLARACPATRISPYPEGLVDWLRATPCDAWLYTGALENHPELVDKLATLRPLLGNPGDVLRKVRDPLVLQQVLRKQGFLFPETRTCGDKLPRDGSWLAKTYRGSSGTGITILDASAEEGIFYQQRISGEPCSAVFAGEVLLGVTRQLVGEAWTGARPFQYCGSLGPWPLAADVEGTLRAWGQLLVTEFALGGLFGVDFVCDGQDAWIIEVNPRYTSSAEVVEQVSGISLIDWHAASRNHGDCPSPPALHYGSTCLGKAILFGSFFTTVTDDFTRWALAQADLADVPAAGTSLSPGQPVLTVGAAAESIPLILSALKCRMGQVEACLRGGIGACAWAS
jgi:predicted ATP-grasp superfamily ATP-dependent carboligase